MDQRHVHAANLVQFQRWRWLFMHRVDVDLIFQSLDHTGDHFGGVFEDVLLSGHHRLVVHPDQHRVELLFHLRQVARPHDHVAATRVNLIFQCQRDRHRSVSLFNIAVVGDDLFDFALLARRQSHDFIANAHDARSDRAREAAKVQVRTQDALHG